MKKSKPYWQMNPQELAAATAEFDREQTNPAGEPLSPEQRRRWQQARRKRGRPRVGRGAKVISLSMEESLLIRTDRAAKARGVSRSQLVADALHRLLAG